MSTDVMGGTRAAMDAGDRILQLGHVPFVPHLDTFWQIVSPKEYEVWLEMDRLWIMKCDVLLRLPGESPGADREVVWAEELGIPIIYDVEALGES